MAGGTPFAHAGSAIRLAFVLPQVMKDLCKDSWDAEYIDKTGEDRQLLYDLILAANYMVSRRATGTRKHALLFLMSWADMLLASLSFLSPLSGYQIALAFGLRQGQFGCWQRASGERHRRAVVLTSLLSLALSQVASLIKGQPLERIKVGRRCTARFARRSLLGLRLAHPLLLALLLLVCRTSSPRAPRRPRKASKQRAMQATEGRKRHSAAGSSRTSAATTAIAAHLVDPMSTSSIDPFVPPTAAASRETSRVLSARWLEVACARPSLAALRLLHRLEDVSSPTCLRLRPQVAHQRQPAGESCRRVVRLLGGWR